MLWALPLIIGQAQMPTGKPEDIGRVRADEVVRMFKRGGLAPKGPFFRLLIVKKDSTVLVKDLEGNHKTKLSAKQRKELDKALNVQTWKALTTHKRLDAYPPSAMDATDIYLSFRDGKAIREWTNVKWQYTGTSLLETLDAYAFQAIGSK